MTDFDKVLDNRLAALKGNKIPHPNISFDDDVSVEHIKKTLRDAKLLDENGKVTRLIKAAS